MQISFPKTTFQQSNEGLIATVPTTTQGKKVQIIFSTKSSCVSASILHKDGTLLPIKPHDYPKEFKLIKSDSIFKKYLTGAYATVGTYNTGEGHIKIHQRLDGGVETKDIPPEFTPFLEKGIEQMNGFNLLPNQVIIVGKVGTGKSLLGNLLNGIELNGVPAADQKFAFEPVDPIFAVSDSNIKACTKLPEAATPNGKDYTIISCPGYGDPGGHLDDIANACFRDKITEKAKRLKIVLLVDFKQIITRATELQEVLQDLIRFLGCCRTAEGLALAAKSIALVVTKAPQPASSFEEIEAEIRGLEQTIRELNEINADQELIQDLQNELERLRANLAEQRHSPSIQRQVEDRLRQYLRNDSNLHKDCKTILRSIIVDSRWTIFSAPTGVGPSNLVLPEKERILDLIENRTPFLFKSKAEIQSKVPSKHEGEVIELISMIKNSLRGSFALSVKQDLLTHLQNLFENEGETALKNFQQSLNQLIQSERTSGLAAFTNALKALFPLSGLTADIAARKHDSLLFFTRILVNNRATANLASEQWLTKLGLLPFFTAINNQLVQALKPPTAVYENHCLTLHGMFCRTSQINQKLDDKNIKDIKIIEIIANHTLIIDDDLTHDKFKGIRIILIAPHIETVHTRYIDVSGANISHLIPQPAESGKAGKPGLPGNCGGHIFALTRKIKRGAHLKMISNGSKGGQGQTGGEGCSGSDGEDARTETLSIHHGRHWDRVGERDGNNNQYHINFGIPGKEGGNGGAPGAGGSKGLPGTITIIELDNPECEVIRELKKGSKGDPGKPGKPGKGGKNGRNWFGVWHFGNGGADWSGHPQDKLQFSKRTRAESGSLNTTINKEGKIKAKETPQINVNLALVSFKKFAYINSALLSWAAPSLQRFCNDFESHESIKSNASVANFIEECNAIEDIYTGASTKSHCLPLFLSLLKRLTNFYSNKTKLSTSDVVKLQTLLGYTLGKICQINAAASPRQVVDILAFLNTLNRNIQELTSLDKNRMITVYQQAYEASIKEQINEAHLYLDNLTTDIKAASSEITIEINNLLDQVRIAMRQEDSKRTDIIRKKHEIEDLMKKKAIVGGLSMATTCIGACFGPPGMLVGGIAAAAIQFIANPSAVTGLSGAASTTMFAANLKAFSDNPPKNDQQRYNEDLIRVRNIAATSTSIISQGNQLNQELQIDSEAITNLQQIIRDFDTNISNMLEYANSAKSILKGSLETYVESALFIQNEIEKRSNAGKDYGRLQNKRLFEDIKTKLQAATGGFPAGSALISICSQLQEAVDTSVTISSRMQDYQDRIELSKYMASLANPRSGVIDHGIDTLQLKAKYNLVSELYTQAINAVRQFAFPFGLHFLGDFANLPAFANAASIGDGITLFQNRISSVLTRVENFGSQTNQLIHSSTLISAYNGTRESPPFYVWTAKDHKKQIAELLKAENGVVFSADISKSPKNHSAIKFKQVAIEFRCADPTVQASLNEKLREYNAELYHLGQSYYRFRNEIYMIPSEGSCNITYSFATNPNGTPITSNLVHENMKEGDHLLSPYTTWAFSLKSRNERDKNTPTLYDVFEEHLDTIDLVLVGKGQYVDETKTTTLQLDPDYEQLKVIMV